MSSNIGSIIARAVCIAAMLCTGRAEAAAPAVVPLGPQQIDALVERAMRTFSVPGAAIGIIQDGRVVYSRGYGVRTLGKQEPVDENTVFAIGSISKGLTTAALAMLVDEGRLRSTVSEHLSPINAAQLRQAHALLESGRMRGKLVLSGF